MHCHVLFLRILSSASVVALLFLGTSSAAAEELIPAGQAQTCRGHWFMMGSCRDRHWDGPELELGVSLGVSAMNESGPFSFHTGIGTIASPGPAWGALVGVEFFPRLALEARYFGMNAAISPTGGFVGSAALGVVRLTAPLPYVHPYVFGGIGYYDFAFVDSSASVMHSSSQPGIPMGIGVDVPLTYHLSLGAEASYNFQIGESYSNVTTNGIDGGDDTRFELVLRARL
jgi:hypothetical protein